MLPELIDADFDRLREREGKKAGNSKLWESLMILSRSDRLGGFFPPPLFLLRSGRKGKWVVNIYLPSIGLQLSLSSPSIPIETPIFSFFFFKTWKKEDKAFPCRLESDKNMEEMQLNGFPLLRNFEMFTRVEPNRLGINNELDGTFYRFSFLILFFFFPFPPLFSLSF